MNIPLLEALISLIIFLFSFGLGLVIYIKSPRNATNKLFFLLSILIDIYIIVNYLSLHPPRPGAENQLFWIRMVMVMTSFIGPITLLLVHTFPREHITLKLRYLIPLGVLMTTSAITSATTLVFKSLEYYGNVPIPIPGAGIPIFFLDFVGLFLVSFTILIVRYRNQIGEEKKKYLYLLLGVVISFSLTSFFTVILVVIFKTSQFVLFGSLAPIILMAFIAYAIVKHGLFDIKIISAQVLTIIILVILFSKIFIAGSQEEILVDVFVFLIAIIFGIFLIRSVIREVGQRERMQNLALQLSEANKGLKRLDQTKSEFISIASHQLRAPLTVIKGYLSLALEGTLGSISKQAKESLGKAAFSTEQLVKLVNELLNLSRMEGGKITYVFAKNNFSLILKNTIKELKPQADQKSLKFILEQKEDLEQFIFDRDKMREVVINLIHNAIKYTHKGTISIRQEIVTHDGQECMRFSVKDNGMGIAKEDISRLFTKFVRSAQAKEVDVNGIGLGLFFVKKVIEDHGGKCWVESGGLGKGSIFTVEIPFKQ